MAGPCLVPAASPPVGAENLVRADHAAYSYSCKRPPRRSRLWTARCVILFELVIGSGSACNGLEFEMPPVGPVFVVVLLVMA